MPCLYPRPLVFAAFVLPFLSATVLAQSDLLPAELAPGTLAALPPVTEAHPRPLASSVSQAGDRVAGVATPLDLMSMDWPPPGLVPFLWTPGGGYRLVEAPNSLGLLTTSAEAVVSGDGTAVVGTFYLTHPDPLVSASQTRAFRWMETEGIQLLPAAAGARSQAHAVSADGRMVVGAEDRPAPASDRMVRWEAGAAPTTLPPLDGHERARARDISADGDVVVGTSFPPDAAAFARTAFRWTAATGSQPIPGLDGYSSSEANAVSADGRVVVGYAFDGSVANLLEAVAFRWSAEDGLALLGTWTPRDVSADGSTVVGSYRTASAVVWTAGQGTRLVRDLLDADGWWLMGVDAVSADGRILVGSGEAPDGTETSWRARMPIE